MTYLPMLIPYFGSKARLAKTYPTPVFDTVIEPFAGGAAYALRHADRKVILVERYPLLANLWRYLVAVTPEEILSLPIVQNTDDAHVCEEAKHLIGWWLNRCTTTPRKQGSMWTRIRPNTAWSVPRRAEIARQVERVKHWKIVEGSYEDVRIEPGTWFVDPPYQVAGRQYVHTAIDYNHLGRWCQRLPGQVIVCENEGASWLPFLPHVRARSSGSGKMTNREAVYVR